MEIGGTMSTCDLFKVPIESVRSSPRSSIDTQLRSQLSQGYTGETWYHYDTPHGRSDPIVIIHFNDIYNIEMNDHGMGGISRFLTAMQRVGGKNPLVLFSGDVFNPSWLSTHTQGRHMVPFLNMLKIHTACFGNHDFDFGIDHLEYLVGSTRFPWLISNVWAAETSEPLANGVVYRIFEWQGYRIGIIGLVESEWIDTLACLDARDIIYKDFVLEANRLSKLLRSKEVELIIALTHMRAHNDERLAREAEDIDLILGGHDHEYYGAHRFGKAIVVKSGSDFREFTKICIYPATTEDGTFLTDESSSVISRKTSFSSDENVHTPTVTEFPSSESLLPTKETGGYLVMPRFLNGSKLQWSCIRVTPELFCTNAHVDIMVGRYLRSIEVEMTKIIGETSVPLETRFGVIRRMETNLGNWLCDLLRHECRVDIAILNSGTIRSDCVFPEGCLRVKDLVTMLPMPDPVVVVSITGQQILDVLENSVSKYPLTEGRFLQVSGMKFSFNPKLPAGKRILEGSVFIIDGNESYNPIEITKSYSLATKEYIQQGKDGFEALADCPILRDAEMNSNLPTIVHNTLKVAALANGIGKPHCLISRRKLSNFVLSHKNDVSKCFGCAKIGDIYKVAPRVEGRIIRIE
ncbi:5'-nucleotidase, C-terminal domain-containing protein [Cardiosporidium cionae]|uniref:5'-nucleotidase, C-terminal domain-containing protein n=1 Tax=Cardiosporidium cionae TaxID=476202 RepID=A0ABQ7JD93_9APIC|nr:5'-nucleotidase, C-terminal domain-containing protein [Cardiosporidium cionae]|eukprot:KAF8822002.1 5'-nucleotidase, C-terminal domain-containing protein [Cardiosporidium cionae]